MDGCSFIREETRYEGLAIETVSETAWVTALPSGTSAQKATLAATNLLINVLPKIPDHSAQDGKDFASLSNTKVKNGWRYTLDEELYLTNLTDQVLDLQNPQGNVFGPKKIKRMPGTFKIQNFQHKSVDEGLCNSVSCFPDC